MSEAVPSSRREFLQGRAVVNAVAGAACELREKLEPAETVVDSRVQRLATDAVITVGRRAMACEFQVMLPAVCRQAVEAASAALDLVDKLEDQLSVYRDTSDVSRINAFAARQAQPVEEQLFGLLQSAVGLHEQTDGAFDVAAGALVKCWGFFRAPKHVPSDRELANVLHCVGNRQLELDEVNRTIAFRRPGVELNLGAIGKGYALDRAAALLHAEWGISAALLHGGRSSAYAIGRPADTGDDAAGWLVGMLHPFHPEQRIATVRLRDCALGTSGAMFQFFEAGGQRFGHILDPRTGRPASGKACVSVVAPTAAQADALSTALFILGPEKTEQFIENHPEIGAVVVTPAADKESLQIDILGRAGDMVTVS